MLQAIWEKEEQAILTKIPPKNPKKLEEHLKVVESIRNTSEEAKQAVRQKWLTYCKSSHLNEVMSWRMECFDMELT